MTAGALAVIEDAEVSAGHDGRAEIVLRVRYPNGASASVRLDEEAAAVVLDGAGVASLSDLRGRPWHVLAPARERRG